MRRHLFLNVILPLLLGIIIYYIFFPETIFVQFIDKFNLISYHIPINIDNVAIRLFRFYVFDFLWAYSLMSLIIFLFGLNTKITIVIFLFYVFMEILQIFPLVQGTFDICDIVVEIIAGILVILISRRRTKNEKE